MDKAKVWKTTLFVLFLVWLIFGINYLMQNDLVGAAIYLATAFILLFMALFSKLGKKK